MTFCTCWIPYPNESHKKENGKWKCVDYYENDYSGTMPRWRCTTRCKMKDGFCKNGKKVEE